VVVLVAGCSRLAHLDHHNGVTVVVQRTSRTLDCFVLVGDCSHCILAAVLLPTHMRRVLPVHIHLMVASHIYRPGPAVGFAPVEVEEAQAYYSSMRLTRYALVAVVRRCLDLDSTSVRLVQVQHACLRNTLVARVRSGTLS